MKDIGSGGFRRVTKKEARRIYDSGEVIRMTGCNIRPDNPHGLYCDCQKDEFTQISSDGFNTIVPRGRDFDAVVKCFTYYNCGGKMGRYPAFYVLN